MNLETNVVVQKVATGNAALLGISSPPQLCAIMRTYIRDSKMLYKDIARKARVSPQTVGRLANGDTKCPRSDTVIAILFALGYKLYIGD